MKEYQHKQEWAGRTKTLTVRDSINGQEPVLISEESLTPLRWISLDEETIDFLRKALDNVDPRLYVRSSNSVVEEPDDIKNFGIM